MPRQYCSLMSAINNAKTIMIENRPKKFKFGCNNYGEINGSRMRNRADGDNWDIISPGYKPLVPHKYKVKCIEGIILLKNGNHKIIVDVVCKHKRKNKREQMKEIRKYMKLYTNFTKVPTSYLKF